MLYALLSVIVATLVTLACAPATTAIDTQTSDGLIVKTDSPVIITSYSFTASRLNYVQLFNESEAIVDLEGWRLVYDLGAGQVVVPVTLSGLMKPHSYTIIAETSVVPSAPFGYLSTPPLADDPSTVEQLTLIPPDTYLAHAVDTPTIKSSTVFEATAPKTYYFQRDVSTSTGNFLSGFSDFLPSDSFTLLLDPFYEYPETTELQVAEILANARDCSPLEKSGDCSDYVKLFNPTGLPIDLSTFRLRIGYQGQNPTSQNTFNLSGSIGAGHFAVFPVNVTNDGGWVWLEDSFGMKRYDATVQSYPSASSETKKGQAWAYDEADGTWKWTTQPTPIDAANVFPPPPPEPSQVDPVSTLVPCDADEYRSTETNRCRNIATSSSSLVPCRSNQYRSKETNRCRNISSSASKLVPCRPNQYRSKETNRCRKIASLANSLVPCDEGQKRNPETNRCRNISKNIPEAAFAIEPIKQSGTAFVGWWALGGVGLLAAGYAGWEWRREMLAAIQKVGAVFSSRK